MRALLSITLPGSSLTYGPRIAPPPITAASHVEFVMVALVSTRQSRIRQSGPMATPAWMVVLPSMRVRGPIEALGDARTVMSTQVLAGSAIWTPELISALTVRAFMMLAA